MTTYISPSLPGMIRSLWKSDLSERSVRTALILAGDLIQELIDLRDQPAEHHEATDADGPTDAEVQAAARALHAYQITVEGFVQDWEDLDEASRQYYIGAARIVLIAAREVSGR